MTGSVSISTSGDASVDKSKFLTHEIAPKNNHRCGYIKISVYISKEEYDQKQHNLDLLPPKLLTKRMAGFLPQSVSDQT